MNMASVTNNPYIFNDNIGNSASVNPYILASSVTNPLPLVNQFLTNTDQSSRSWQNRNTDRNTGYNLY